MRFALTAAWEYQLLTFPNPAVGAVCLSAEGMVLSIGVHKRSGGPHAEVYALRDAYTRLSGDDTIAHSDDSHHIHDYLRTHHRGLFHTVWMAVTLEPCSHHGKTPSCALLIRDMGIKHLFISIKDPNPIASNGATLLREAGISCTFGILEAEGKHLLAPFLHWQTRPFVFFKWAQRLDGTIDGGAISSLKARKHVHALRDRCDLMVIGGNTVRTDRPTLDARLVGGKAPDIMIYSHHDDFDRTIPLFHIPNRKVFVTSSLDNINEYSLVMIEGGRGMFEATGAWCEWYACYLAPILGGGCVTMGNITEKFEVLHAKIDDTILLWMRKNEECL